MQYKVQYWLDLLYFLFWFSAVPERNKTHIYCY